MPLRYTIFVQPISKRILVLTPWVPYPVSGACQQDRFNGFLQLKDLGHEIHVIAKVHAFQNKEEIMAFFTEKNIPLTLVPYSPSLIKLLLKRLPRIVRTPGLIDGSALEYTDPLYEQTVLDAVQTFKPDVAWIEYTFSWPVLRLLKPFGIPTIMKSSLDEPKNCRDENGWSLSSIIKSIPKYPGERIAARESDFIFAISPIEEKIYRKLGAKRAGTLPLRGISECLRRKTHADKDVLDVVYLSSSYSMGHNRDALDFILQKVIPLIRVQAPGKFRFHFTGKKFPKASEKYLGADAQPTGFVPDIGELLAKMDIAVCPWISGTGMQQKVFEPLCRGLPLVTNHLAGYPIEPGKEYLNAVTPEEYVHALLELRSAPRRQEISDAAFIKTSALFSREAVQKIAQGAIDEVTTKIED